MGYFRVRPRAKAKGPMGAAATSQSIASSVDDSSSISSASSGMEMFRNAFEELLENTQNSFEDEVDYIDISELTGQSRLYEMEPELSNMEIIAGVQTTDENAMLDEDSSNVYLDNEQSHQYEPGGVDNDLKQQNNAREGADATQAEVALKETSIVIDTPSIPEREPEQATSEETKQSFLVNDADAYNDKMKDLKEECTSMEGTLVKAERLSNNQMIMTGEGNVEPNAASAAAAGTAMPEEPKQQATMPARTQVNTSYKQAPKSPPPMEEKPQQPAPSRWNVFAKIRSGSKAPSSTKEDGAAQVPPQTLVQTGMQASQQEHVQVHPPSSNMDHNHRIQTTETQKSSLETLAQLSQMSDRFFTTDDDETTEHHDSSSHRNSSLFSQNVPTEVVSALEQLGIVNNNNSNNLPKEQQQQLHSSPRCVAETIPSTTKKAAVLPSPPTSVDRLALMFENGQVSHAEYHTLKEKIHQKEQEELKAKLNNLEEPHNDDDVSSLNSFGSDHLLQEIEPFPLGSTLRNYNELHDIPEIQQEQRDRVLELLPFRKQDNEVVAIAQTHSLDDDDDDDDQDEFVTKQSPTGPPSRSVDQDDYDFVPRPPRKPMTSKAAALKDQKRRQEESFRIRRHGSFDSSNATESPRFQADPALARFLQLVKEDSQCKREKLQALKEGVLMGLSASSLSSSSRTRPHHHDEEASKMSISDHPRRKGRASLHELFEWNQSHLVRDPTIKPTKARSSSMKKSKRGSTSSSSTRRQSVRDSAAAVSEKKERRRSSSKRRKSRRHSSQKSDRSEEKTSSRRSSDKKKQSQRKSKSSHPRRRSSRSDAFDDLRSKSSHERNPVQLGDFLDKQELSHVKKLPVSRMQDLIERSVASGKISSRSKQQQQNNRAGGGTVIPPNVEALNGFTERYKALQRGQLQRIIDSEPDRSAFKPSWPSKEYFDSVSNDPRNTNRR